VPSLVEELRRSFADQVGALESEIDSRFGRLEPSKSGIRGALEVIRAYPQAVRKSLNRHELRSLSDDDLIAAIRLHLTHVERVWAIFEQWFGRGSATSFPRSLARAVDSELEACNSNRRAVLAVGPPGELETWIPDLLDQVFAMIQVPRLQGVQALWRPLILGHELMHLMLEDGKSKLPHIQVADFTGNASGVRIPRPVLEYYEFPDNPFESLGESWLEELLCDAYAVRRFGPASVAAFGSFFDSGYDEEYTEHPPSEFRLHAMLQWLDTSNTNTGGPEYSRLEAMLEPARERASALDDSWPRWVRVLTGRFSRALQNFPEYLARWPEPYVLSERRNEVLWIADRLTEGLPSDLSMSGHPLTSADILNGAWLAWSEGAPTPVDRLALKSLETIELNQLWIEAEAGLPRPPRLRSRGGKIVADPSINFGGVLPSHEIIKRLDECPNQIHTVPLPLSVEGTAMDIRLGNRFIVFEPSGIAAFDPVNPSTDPRVIQGVVEKDWGEHFVLHPGDLVLAAAHEYISLPGDVSCLLITRSSYGRLGLVTATAVLVHPYYQGCLTLELVNLGTVPLVLTPGERIAQLIFLRVFEPAHPPAAEQKYHCPTGPEFSKIHTDHDSRIIAEISKLRLEDMVG
jgi:deoxycytidine triphosphate deaminase